MIWPFKRAAPPLHWPDGWLSDEPKAADRRRMNEDWRAGDLAQCVFDRFHNPAPGDPVVGEVRRVRQVMDALGNGGARAYFLKFEGGVDGYECVGFRKLRPVIEPAEAGFTATLRDTLSLPLVAQP